jgi:hypothetical protein
VGAAAAGPRPRPLPARRHLHGARASHDGQAARTRRLSLVLAYAAWLTAPSGAAAADRFTIERPVASLRSGPGSFAIAHVFAGDTVDVVGRSGGWVYGLAGGRCGWLMDEGLRAAGSSSATCPPPETLDPALLFAPHSYQLGCGEGCVYPARVLPCADRTVYANYDPLTATFADPAGVERVGRGTRGPRVPRYAEVRFGYAGFGVRYTTPDGLATLIKDTRRGHVPTWVFMHAECLERIALVVRADAIGAFRLGGRRARAVRAFGRTVERDRCRMTWPKIALTLFGCRRLRAAAIDRQPIRGAALVHTWATARGLRLGDRAAVLRQLYPGARRRHGAFALEPGLRAVVRRGRVRRFLARTSGG